MPAPVLSSFAQRLYDSVSPLAADDANNSYALAQFCAALGDMFQVVDDYSRDQVINGVVAPGWSQILDLTRAPSEVLSWLAQFVGVSVTHGLSDADQRTQIKSVGGWNRGTIAAMRAAAQATLTGNKIVNISERSGDAYTLVVTTQLAETPNAVATLAALQSQKPAGINLVYVSLNGQTYSNLFTNHPTYSDVFTSYSNYENLLHDILSSGGPLISSADVNAAVTSTATLKALVSSSDHNTSVVEVANNPSFGSALAALPPESTGTIFYVAPPASGGSDSNAGTLLSPWATLDKAMATLTGNQKCYVRNGNYGVANAGTRLVWSANGSAGNMISIEAYPGESPVLWQSLHITGTFLRFRGFKVDRNAIIVAKAGNAFGWDTATSTNYPGEVGLWNDGSNIHIDKVEIRNQRWTGFLIGSGSNLFVTNCWIHNNGSTHDDHGVYYNGGGTGCLVYNCIFERNADLGIQFYPSPSGVTITNCGFHYNGSVLGQPAGSPYPQYTGTGTTPYGNSTDGSGLIVNATAAGIKIVNCTAVGNVINGFRTLGTVTSTQVSLFSNCHANGNPNGGSGANFDAQMTTLGVNLVTGNPLFTSTGDTFPGAVGVPGNYKPTAGSPLISAGLAAYTPPTDMNGVTRVTADIGPISS